MINLEAKSFTRRENLPQAILTAAAAGNELCFGTAVTVVTITKWYMRSNESQHDIDGLRVQILCPLQNSGGLAEAGGARADEQQ
eukprot:COSAG06_NODE_484_length_15127_cov_3.402116_2_plen_84_part_00